MERPTNPEVLLISAVIQTGDVTTPTAHGITPEYFHGHRAEWEWIEHFRVRHLKAPDKATFRAQFPDFPLLKTTDVSWGVEEVEKAHLRHSLAKMYREGTRYLMEDDPHTALTFTHSSIVGIDHSSGSRDGFRNVLTDYEPVLEEARRRYEASTSLGYAGVPLGFTTLNERTGGLHPGDLAIWAARLGQGKTWMLVKIAAEAVLSGKDVCFVSLEQTRSQIAFRIHTILARELGYNLRHRDLMQGTNIDLDEYQTFLIDLPNQVKGSLYISDPSRGRANPFTLAALMERHSPDLMLVDYLTLMQQDGDDWRATAQLSADTKLVAGQYGVPILAAAQINREGDGGRRPPSAKNLAQSDAIGQDADVIITHKQESPTVLQGMLAKNRSGQSGQCFYSRFEPNEGKIEEISFEDAQTMIANDMVDDD